MEAINAEVYIIEMTLRRKGNLRIYFERRKDFSYSVFTWKPQTDFVKIEPKWTETEFDI